MDSEKSIEFECPGCRAVYEPAHERTIVVTYDDPTYNHIVTICPVCDHKLMLFFDNPAFLTLGYDMQHNFHPPQRVQEVYEGIMGRPEPQGDEPDQPTEEINLYEEKRQQIGELEPRLEGEIERMRRVLESTPEDLLFDALAAGAGHRDVPPGHTKMPQRWK